MWSLNDSKGNLNVKTGEWFCTLKYPLSSLTAVLMYIVGPCSKCASWLLNGIRPQDDHLLFNVYHSI